ncbi:MAG: membrane protein insertion efficiency factor YidD [Selenomonadaceae bacterium]|nr:membrane protein insertion efficiency factor YidD [Selenomonadaceae bacterium]
MTRLLITLIKIYQRWLSPLKAPCCRFVPTCSAYALDALTKYGWAYGGWLTLKRLLRCNPFCKGGYDPVK